MSSPELTWLMPVLNGMPYIVETLASIEAQRFQGHVLLVWDNGSNDGTVEELNRWVPSRIPGRVISDRPLSLPRSLAELVALAKSPLCARIDADDVNDPARLAKQVLFLKRNPQVVAVGSQVRRLSPAGERGSQYGHLPLTHEGILVRLLRQHALWHPSVTFRREDVLLAGGYLDERPVEDYSLWLRLARVGRLANLPDILLDYRVHPESVTRLALKEGVLHDKTDDCVARHGSPLFGLSELEIRDLRSGRPLTFPGFWKMKTQLNKHHARVLPLLYQWIRQEFLPRMKRKAPRTFRRRNGPS